ncbi:MAG: hypothetical protein M1838_005649 [Thelocarpon superellum]|nr:MAG: hypothetical protein M1838_005649 [Thelocarpon superellum]
MKALTAGDRSLIEQGINAIKGRGIGHGASVQEVAVPEIADNEVLVKVHSVALNPTDYKHIDNISPAHSIIGCDYAGEVAAVGNGPEASSRWKVGDRIAGVVHGGSYPDKGSFAEYLKVEADLAARVPEGVSNHDAATYGVSAATAMQGVYHTLHVPWPDASTEEQAKAPPSILVYAGSTTASLFAIQMAKHAGLRVVTTCSPHSFALVKRYGADAAFDYRSDTALADIKKAFPDLTCAFDGISEGGSQTFCAEAMGPNGGAVIALLKPEKTSIPHVQIIGTLAYTLMGQPFQWFAPLGPKFEAKPDDRAALARFYALLPSLTSWLKAPPTQLVPGGFDGLLPGLDMLRKGKVSGRKLVVDLA